MALRRLKLASYWPMLAYREFSMFFDRLEEKTDLTCSREKSAALKDCCISKSLGISQGLERIVMVKRTKLMCPVSARQEVIAPGMD